MASIRIYTTRSCPFCIMAKRLLDARGLSYDEVSVDGDPEGRQRMTELAGRHTVPQIFIGDVHVGGCDELHAADASGELDTLINNNGTNNGATGG